LSPGELKICALMLTGLSTREMSTMLGVTDRAVEKHRYKIRRKLELPRSTNLNDYLGRLQGG
jgi:DNA-binding CsgD family transcriptional regulator